MKHEREKMTGMKTNLAFLFICEKFDEGSKFCLKNVSFHQELLVLTLLFRLKTDLKYHFCKEHLKDS